MGQGKKEKGSGNLLSFLLSIIFFLLIGAGFHTLNEADILLRDLNSVTAMEFIILTLAVFRLQRLFVYDKVAQFIRDLFLVTTEEYDKAQGVTYVMRAKYPSGIRRLFADLLSCPWCVGMWAAVFAVIIYYMYPWTWPLWLLLAVAGASSFVQILTNMIGWKAEHRKIIVQDIEDHQN